MDAKVDEIITRIVALSMTKMTIDEVFMNNLSRIRTMNL
jgi:hypothetical protein